MSKYNIVRWDPVQLDNNTHALPMIYIKPDKAFLKFVEENNYTVIVRIEGTGTIYDGKAMVGIVNSSATMPNYRPNFYITARYAGCQRETVHGVSTTDRDPAGMFDGACLGGDVPDATRRCRRGETDARRVHDPEHALHRRRRGRL